MRRIRAMARSSITFVEHKVGAASPTNGSDTSTETSLGGTGLAAAKLAPDGKVYYAGYSRPYMAVVSDPNAAGTASNFNRTVCSSVMFVCIRRPESDRCVSRLSADGPSQLS